MCVAAWLEIAFTVRSQANSLQLVRIVRNRQVSLATMLTPYTLPPMNVGEDAPDAAGEVHMFCETEFMRGGRVFGRCNGGYEKASKGEKIVLDSVADAFMCPPAQVGPSSAASKQNGHSRARRLETSFARGPW